MSQKKNYVLLGAGGHAKVLYEILRLNQLPVAGYISKENLPDAFFQELDYLGNDDTQQITAEQYVLVNTLGSIKNTQPRQSLYQRYKAKGFAFPAITHPAAIISSSAQIAQGVQVLAGAVINAAAVIEENTIINTRAVIEHDCHIGTHNHIAPGAVICGNVSTGANVHIGAGAVINQGLHISDNAVIASGAVVISNVSENALFAGVPAAQKK